MKKIGTIDFETNRLFLRKFRLEDANEMFNNWANNKNVCGIELEE